MLICKIEENRLEEYRLLLPFFDIILFGTIILLRVDLRPFLGALILRCTDLPPDIALCLRPVLVDDAFDAFSRCFTVRYTDAMMMVTATIRNHSGI